jgi:hypothetical protein
MATPKSEIEHIFIASSPSRKNGLPRCCVRRVAMADDETVHYDYAAECVRQAEQTEVPEQRALLLTMAQAWERLAAQSERIRAIMRRADSDNT